MVNSAPQSLTPIRHLLPPSDGRAPLSAHRPSPLTHSHATRAFTMIELIVVIGIIALLLAIAVPTASRVLDNQRRNNTMSSMEVIENAIDAYRRCKAVGAFPPGNFSIKDLIPGPDESFTDNNNNLRWDKGIDTLKDDDGDGDYHSVNVRDTIPGVSPNATFKPIWRMPADAGDNYASSSYDKEGDYKDIETLYLYITQLCPEGKQILENLPPSRVTNKDSCRGSDCSDLLVFDTNGNDQNDRPYNTLGKDKAVDLFEVRDEWGLPLRYSTTFYGVGGAADRNDKWELRSAGPDGRFAGAFTPADKSGDDVVILGE